LKNLQGDEKLSEYRRFIAYIYRYTEGKKQKNTGFAKVESRNGICRMQIHLQRIPQEEEALNIYGFVREGGWLLGILLGKMYPENGVGEVHLQTDAKRIGGSTYSFEELSGLWLRSSLGGTYLTVFDEEETDVERLVTELPAEKDICEEADSEEADSEEADREESDSQEEAPVCAQSTACPCPYRNGMLAGKYLSEENRKERWQRLGQRCPHLDPFSEGSLECIQVTLHDLFWFLQGERWNGNNSFLIRGFRNYRHLLLGKDKEGRCFLGVPGIMNRQERYMAEMFGFPLFREGKEGQKEETFGYWCRSL
jgi:hypothetical protein